MFTIFSYKITEKQILITILLLGALLRFWGLGSAEFYHDEGFFAFRSIGYFDYIQNEDQSTPVQWFRDTSLPWWTFLSSHNPPPLFFFIQNIFFRIFGDSLFAARLPSALAGIASIYLVYLIFNSMFEKSDGYSGLLAVFLLSVNLIHVWLSRSSLMEAFQVFLILLNIYYFFQFLNDRRRWKLFGITLGLAFLTKYTSIFLVPVYVVYLFVVSRKLLVVRQWYAAFGLAAIIFSPVLIYNFYLYKTLGHFDLQFSYLFGQTALEWRASLGKIQDPFSEIISNLNLMYSIPFLLLTITGIGYAIYEIYKSNSKALGKSDFQIFWLLNLIFITLMLAVVGSAFRFIALYAVPAVMLIAYLFDYFYSKFYPHTITSSVKKGPAFQDQNSFGVGVNKEVIFKILAAAFLVYELIFGMDIFRTFPDFGIVTLDKYFDAEFGNRRSQAIPSSPNPHLDRVIKKNALHFPDMGKTVLIVYDTNVALSPRLWLFSRRNYYHGIPALSVDQFRHLLKTGGIDRFKDYEIYFAKASKNTPINPTFYTNSGEELEAFLRQSLNLSPTKMIYGYNNLLMFTVYKFSI